MVDFAKTLKDDRRKNLKVYRMDDYGYYYWAGHSVQACYDHHLQITGVDEDDGFKLESIYELSDQDLLNNKMEMDDQRVLTFREALDELIELKVEFPRFFCGREM